VAWWPRLDYGEPSRVGIPLPDQTADVAISNGVINLSFRKRRVIEELFRVLKPGGRLSITDIVSAKQLSQSIVNDPKLWASLNWRRSPGRRDVQVA
jgi:SAM-dependent methyltransferase